ncbi:MAG: tail fiber domain-containing protein [Chitinophagaceae bacterium]|nr:tail fiber domain-containing protein [Chitinophagaceae bacterium]
MLHTKNLPAFLLLLLAGIFASFISSAQLTVLPNGNVGIGNPAPLQKLDVVLNAADPAQEAARFANNSNTALVKYGIRNTVSNAGTGSRYGIYNDVLQLSTSAATSYGIRTALTAGTGGGYGIYNQSNAGGNGFRYGIYNFVSQASTTGNMALGLYNYTSNTVGYTYGLYNYNAISGTSAFTNFGQYNYLYSAGTATNYGIYSYVSTATATTPGNRYGIWTEVANTGSGIRYGIYARSLGAANYAGYFDGNVFVNGALTVVSDDAVKTNLAPIDDALGIITRLSPKSFDFRTDINGMAFPEGKQYGVMASEVERDLPALVRKVTTPMNNPNRTVSPRPEDPQSAQTGNDSYFSLRTVNYIGLIPVLVQAVKDQQQMIGTLRQQLQEQQVMITRLQAAAK